LTTATGPRSGSSAPTSAASTACHAKVLIKGLNKEAGEERYTMKFLYGLFPDHPMRRSCRYAGVPSQLAAPDIARDRAVGPAGERVEVNASPAAIQLQQTGRKSSAHTSGQPVKGLANELCRDDGGKLEGPAFDDGLPADQPGDEIDLADLMQPAIGA